MGKTSCLIKSLKHPIESILNSKNSTKKKHFSLERASCISPTWQKKSNPGFNVAFALNAMESCLVIQTVIPTTISKSKQPFLL